jgi:hypothetical protein
VRFTAAGFLSFSGLLKFGFEPSAGRPSADTLGELSLPDGPPTLGLLPIENNFLKPLLLPTLARCFAFSDFFVAKEGGAMGKGLAEPAA